MMAFPEPGLMTGGRMACLLESEAVDIVYLRFSAISVSGYAEGLGIKCITCNATCRYF